MAEPCTRAQSIITIVVFTVYRRISVGDSGRGLPRCSRSDVCSRLEALGTNGSHENAVVMAVLFAAVIGVVMIGKGVGSLLAGLRETHRPGQHPVTDAPNVRRRR